LQLLFEHWAISYVVSLSYCFVFSDWQLVRRHPCGVTVVNVVWLIEQLHTPPVLLALFRDKAPVADFIQSILPLEAARNSGNSGGSRDIQDVLGSGATILCNEALREVPCMDELCSLYDTFMQQRQRQDALSQSQPQLGSLPGNGTQSSAGPGDPGAAVSSSVGGIVNIRDANHSEILADAVRPTKRLKAGR
jgi:hypothetical protein